jgi:decaprenylphospho-beta-D-ribofuranose 2-oxidase
MRSASLALAGWGRLTAPLCEASRPERMSEAEAELAGADGIVLHGAGRSYGDCALNGGGRALITTRLDRILAFDAETGIVQVEPGVDFRRLLDVFLPRGFMVPVTPGTSFATIGGAVANDVHGKNHEHAGSFGQYVTEMEVVLPDGARRTLTPRDTELFRATVGGLGLTGMITRIAFRMVKVPGARVRVREERCTDLENFLSAMARAQDATYSVGWIDGTAQGRALGRGILETAEHVDSELRAPAERKRAIPIDFPGFALNPLSVTLFNEAYYRRVPAEGRVQRIHVQKFLYPLDAIHGWNRIYGKRGFVQFQCVVPYENGATALRELLTVIAAARQASFLAVLKRMGPGRAGYLSFPTPGYTLALDFPNKPGVEDLYARLVAITLAAGGRIYLGKDALLDAHSFRLMYPEFGAFSAVLAQIDPAHRMRSDMARRLRLQDAP